MITPFHEVSLISFIMLIFGAMKLASSKSLVGMLISMEMMMVGIFCLISMKYWAFSNIHVIVGFLVIVVVEGVVGLIIITHLFRVDGVKSSACLFF